VIVLIVRLHHVEDHRLNCLAGIAPYAEEALQRVHCYLFQLLAKKQNAARVNMKMMPATGKALMTHAAACFGAGESAFQPSSNSPVEALVSSSGWMRNHAT
jgi:hypothetical protein